MGLGGAFVVIIVMATLLAILVWQVSTRFSTVTRVITRSFWCPIQGRQVTAEFQEAVWDGRLVEVNACSAFSPAQAVTCEKVCLRLQKLPSARSEW